MTTPPCRNPDCSNHLRKRLNSDTWQGAEGYCGGCYDRWWTAGKPDAGPPPPVPPGERHRSWLEEQTAGREARKVRLGRLISYGTEISDAARIVGVSIGTAYVYRTELGRGKRQERRAA